MSRIIGIDLGTTNSLVAVWENGESKLIPNAFGEYLTPSVVSFDEDGTVYVGKTAKERLAHYPAMTASIFKRYMGTSRKYRFGEKTYLPEELSAMVLRKLKEDAERYLGEEVEEAIISVPAYFNDIARNATKRAGVLAGLRVDRIINEPSAAALAYHQMKEEDAVFMVFDFGGGTLDVSLVECFDSLVEILSVSGDNQLGGQDFDDMIGTYFIKAQGMDPHTITPETRAIIRSSAEKCKRKLTDERSAQMVVNCDQINAKMEITRKDVVKACAVLFERMGKPIRRVLMDAKMTPDKIDHIVLVGGSCKMPIVKQYLQHILGRKDITTVNPDYMIAIGCGVCAGIKERDNDIKEVVLTDICPFSLGTGVHNDENPSRSLMSFIIQRNSPLPVSCEQTYVNAYDNQTEIGFRVFQGEAMYVDENTLLGELKLHIPPCKAGEVKCHVRYTYDINGVLEVNVHIPLNGVKRRLVIVDKNNHLTQEEIEKKLKEYEKLKMNPIDDEENKYVISHGEKLFMQCSNDYKEEIAKKLQYFQYILKHDPYQVPKVRKYLTVFFATLERLTDNYVEWDELEVEEGNWYEDEEDREIDNLFREWEEKETN